MPSSRTASLPFLSPCISGSQDLERGSGVWETKAGRTPSKRAGKPNSPIPLCNAQATVLYPVLEFKRAPKHEIGWGKCPDRGWAPRMAMLRPPAGLRRRPQPADPVGQRSSPGSRPWAGLARLGPLAAPSLTLARSCAHREETSFPAGPPAPAHRPGRQGRPGVKKRGAGPAHPSVGGAPTRRGRGHVPPGPAGGTGAAET